MTDKEICLDFLLAKDRRRQIKVLAELTMRTKDQIKQILLEGGIDPSSKAPKYKQTIEPVSKEVVLPTGIRKEVTNYVNQRNRICRR